MRFWVVVSSPHRSSLLALLLAVAACFGCSAGEGEGTLITTVWAPGCGLEAETIDLQPDFFSIDPFKDFDIVDIRIQHGSDFEDLANGMIIQINNAEYLKTMGLGQPISLERGDGTVPEPTVRMTLYLNERCPKFREDPVVYESVDGTIIFDALYVPWVDGERLTQGTFSNVVFEDRNQPEIRHAIADGEFEFLYERGRPAQRFP